MPLRVILASAGSGKTESLATHTLSALRDASHGANGIPGVLALTFTRNAAAELRERILQKVYQQQEIDLLRRIILGQAPLYTSTIDAFTREVYYRLAPLLGLPAYTALIVEVQDTAEASFTIVESMLTQLSQPARLKLLRKKMQSYLWEKGRRALPAELLEEAVENQLKEGPIRSRIRLALYQWVVQQGTPFREESSWYKALKLRKSDAALAEWVYEAMQAYRQSARKLFLSDMQAVVLLVARQAPFLLAEQAYFFHHLLVDEAQDTSPAQWELLQPIFEELQGRGHQITLIGDPKQSIYGWRDADFRQLLHYAERADKKDFLDTNYRSHEAIVCFNNKLYSELPHRLSEALPEKDKKKGKKVPRTLQIRLSAIAALEELYDPKAVCQKANRLPKALGPYVKYIVLPPKPESFPQRQGETPDTEPLPSPSEESIYRCVLRDILDRLQHKGIPPEQTAFLVRRNYEIQKLFRLLPDYPLQVQSVALGTCTTLAATMGFLEAHPSGSQPNAQPSSVEEYFLFQQPKAEALLQALSEIRVTFSEQPASFLQKWLAFHRLRDLWLERYQHAPFWDLFLSELYNFLAKHPFYGLAEVLRWWRSRARSIMLNLPPVQGVYPVLTIHKAKGLAWDAVILPFVSWNLLRASSPREVRWYRVPYKLVPDSLAQTLQGLSDLAFPDAWELPLSLSSESADLQDLYEDAYVDDVVENVNLHYVATTRPREYLFLVIQAPSGRGHGGVNTWAGFWSEIYRKP